ncbi:MAG: Panacea domain-containing protein [Acidobacteria bacterium]|nr:Panacea domain-containing protein [Acidobacteriota bacterium]
MGLDFTFDFEATKAALLCLALKELPHFDKYRASKLLFLADREHLLRFGRPITGDSYSALPYGPTPNRVLSLLNGLEKVALEGDAPLNDEVAELVLHFDVAKDEYATYHAKSQPDLDALSISDLKVLDRVVAEHGRKTFNELKDLTHGMRAYTKAWRNDEVRKKYPMVFEDFFAEEPDKADFLKELEENQQLRRAFPDLVCA